MKDLYTARVRVAGGRDGSAQSDDERLSVTLALPKAIGGSGAGTNPEQLFAAGFAGCFASSIRFVAHQKGLDAGDVSVTADVVLGLEADGRYRLRATLSATVPNITSPELETVIAEAKRICAYTNATRGNVETTYTVNGA